MAGDEQGRPNEEAGDGLSGGRHQEHRLLHGRGAALGGRGDTGRGCGGRGQRRIWGQCGLPHRHGAQQQGGPGRNPGRDWRTGLERGNHTVSLSQGQGAALGSNFQVSTSTFKTPPDSDHASPWPQPSPWPTPTTPPLS